MTENTAPASPLQALARNWWLALALPLVLAVAGFLVGGSRPTQYTAESRVAVGSGSLSSGAIAGFPTASQQLADNYARWVNNRGIELESDSRADGESDATVTASPIPESNVIRIEAKSHDRAKAVAAATKTAKDLVAEVNTKKADSDPAATLDQMNKLAEQWGTAKAASEAANTAANRAIGADKSAGVVAAAQKAAASAAARAATLQAQMDALSDKYRQQVSQGSTAADLRVVAEASLSSSTKASNQQRGALIGLVIGLALALALAMMLERSRRRQAVRPTPGATATRAAHERRDDERDLRS